MPDLHKHPMMQDFQQYVQELEKERGFDGQPIIEKGLLLGEEIGELYKAIRKHEKMRTDDASETFHIEEECADVFIYLCAIANYYDIDLENAFRKKEEVNKKRSWQ